MKQKNCEPQRVTSGSPYRHLFLTLLFAAASALFAQNAAAASIASISPNSGNQGQTLTGVQIVGSSTHFQAGTTAVTFSGSGVTASSITVADSTHLSLRIAIANTAPATVRNVTVTTGTETARLLGGFTVLPGTPVIVSLNPNHGKQAETLATVAVTGRFTHFAQGVTQLSIDPGIQISAINVTSATALTATLAIGASVATGAYTVTATTGSETAIRANGFTVDPGTPALLSIVPNTGQQDQTLTAVQITGQFTHFIAAAPTVTFSGTQVTASAVTAADDTHRSLTVKILAGATLGARDVTVQTGSERESLTGGFTVTVPPTTIQGTVFAVDGKTPVAAASVRLYNSTSLAYLGVVTADSQGAFSFGAAAGKFALYAFDRAANPTQFGYATLTAASGSHSTKNVRLSGTGRVTASVVDIFGNPAAQAIVGLAPSLIPVPANLQTVLHHQQTAGADGQTVFTSYYACPLIANATDSNAKHPGYAYGSLSNKGSLPVTIYLGVPEAVSDVITAQNGTIGGPLLPPGQNEAVSKIMSALNGTIGGTLLPPGLNVAISKIVSAQNGTIGGPLLPAGENVAVSKIVSAQNGTIGGPLLPPGKNEAVSKLVSAAVSPNEAATLRLQSKKANTAGSDSIVAGDGTALVGTKLAAGETVTVAADLPSQIYLNGVRTGNDAGSANALTFVVPEARDSLSVRAGAGADSLILLPNGQARMLVGRVVDEAGAPVPNAAVRLRHAGLRAEFFELTEAPPPGEAPILGGSRLVSEEPVSSLNLHNPEQVFGYFPVGKPTKPGFAVRLSGEFLAETGGEYAFFVAGSEGARFTIDGQVNSTVHGVKFGLESRAAVDLAPGWRPIELLVWCTTEAAELAVSIAPPGGSRQPIGADHLRAESQAPGGITGPDGRFEIAAPVWLDEIEALVDSDLRGVRRSGVSGKIQRGADDFGEIHIVPGSAPALPGGN